MLPNRRGAPSAVLFENGFGHNRARRIVRAEKQHVESRCHALILIQGKQACEIAAQLGPAAAAGFSEKAEQAPKADDAQYE